MLGKSVKLTYDTVMDAGSGKCMGALAPVPKYIHRGLTCKNGPIVNFFHDCYLRRRARATRY